MEKSTGPNVREFFDEFWRSFRKACLFFGSVSVALFLFIYFAYIPDLGNGITVLSALKIASIYLSVLLFGVYSWAWAGAIHRCALEAEAVAPAIAVGALIVAILAGLIMLYALDFPLLGTIFPSFMVFLLSGFSITWSWFTLALAGPFWW